MADNNRKLSKALDNLDNQISDLYTTTYHVSDVQDLLYNKITDDLDDSIAKATGDDEYKNLSNISKLYQKLSNKISVDSAQINIGKGNDSDISTLFQSPDVMSGIMDAYAKTKSIKEFDNEFDTICKYMPKLQTALDIKKDAVLCSDLYSKKFIRILPKNDTQQQSKKVVLENNIDNLVTKYDLEAKLEYWYDITSKYGEVFVYCVPYNKAFKTLLSRRNGSLNNISESVVTSKGELVKLGAKNSKVKVDDGGIHINFDKSNVIREAIENNTIIRNAINNSLLTGISEFSVLDEAKNGESITFDDHIKSSGGEDILKFDKTIPNDELKVEDYDKTAAQGLFPNEKNNSKDTTTKVNGCVLKTITHDKFIPIYIENTFFGGYYIEADLDAFSDMDNSIATNTSSVSTGSITSLFRPNSDGGSADDQMIKSVAGKISDAINATFINTNSDLSKEIYLMLKYNDKYNVNNSSLNMNVTFIPADDIHHLKFKTDPVTHRGISDLWDSLVAAKQWIMLNITTSLGQAIRGYDRRIYYVKQQLDTNVAQSLLNVISQIKKGNFGVRQMESVTNMIGMLGRFNDYIIPTDSNGTAPISFDTQPGQQFDFPADMMQNLEESAISSTGVPVEIVNSSTGMDFAIRYTMTNAKLLRNVLKRQGIIENFMDSMVTKLYYFEFEQYEELELKLPIPAYLSLTQGQQLLQTAVQYADSRVEIDMLGETDEAKAEYKKILISKLIPGYISEEEIASIKDKAKINLSLKQVPDQSDNGGEEEY